MIHYRRLFQSFGYAWQGIVHALKNDQNFIVHLLAAIFVIILGLLLKINSLEMAILGSMIVLVISTEMINTAIENMVDLITKEHREEAKIAKDVSSGMVLISSVGAVIVGLIIFFPYLLGFLK